MYRHFFFFLIEPHSRWDLSSQTGMEPEPPALGAPSLFFFFFAWHALFNATHRSLPQPPSSSPQGCSRGAFLGPVATWAVAACTGQCPVLKALCFDWTWEDGVSQPPGLVSSRGSRQCDPAPRGSQGHYHPASRPPQPRESGQTRQWPGPLLRVMAAGAAGMGQVWHSQATLAMAQASRLMDGLQRGCWPGSTQAAGSPFAQALGRERQVLTTGLPRSP